MGFEVFFLIFGNADIQFPDQELTWRAYTTQKDLLTTQRVELINKKKFAKIALDENVKAILIYVVFFTLKITIYLAREAHIALLLTKKDLVLEKHLNFADLFSKKSAEVLSKRIGINKYAINMQEGKKPSYGSIYRLGPIELKTLNTYIKTNLANGFI